MAVSLVTTTGTHKSRYANVGAPGNLQLTGTDTLSAAAIVRADAAATGKRQFGARLTSAVDNTFVIGIDDGTKNLDDLSFDIPGRHTTGGFVLIIGTWGWEIWKASSVIHSDYSGGASGIAQNDDYEWEYDTAAGTASIFRTRSGTTTQLGSTLTGISLSAYRAFVGAFENAVYLANFAGPFSHALSSGYSAYDASSSPTTHTVTAAVITYAEQAITNNAQRLSTVTAASLAYAGQSITNNAKRLHTLTAQTISYAGQSIVNNAQKVHAITAAAVSYAGQSISHTVRRISTITAATITYAGRAIDTGGEAARQVVHRIGLMLGFGL